MEESCHLKAPVALSQGTGPLYPLNIRLGGPQSQSEHFRAKKNLLFLPGIKPRDLSSPGLSEVNTMATPSQLECNNITYNDTCSHAKQRRTQC